MMCDAELIDVYCLGAGQDVGRSCILVRARGQHVLLDCGAHLAYNDERRFPDFSQLRTHAARPAARSAVVALPQPAAADYTSLIDCVLLTHFHLDHSGALPRLTERCGYRGPVLMSAPTRALTHVILNDYWRLQCERRGVPESQFYSRTDIDASLRRARCMQVLEIILTASCNNNLSTI